MTDTLIAYRKAQRKNLQIRLIINLYLEKFSFLNYINRIYFYNYRFFEMELDSKDRLILSLLQRDVTLGLQTIAQRVGLSPTPCWRRIQKLEQNGVIRAKVALLDKTQLNLGVTVFVSIKTSSHSQAWLDRFKQLLSEIPEIIEAHRLSGNVDYLLQIVVPDIDRYDVIYKKLIEHLDFADISSAFAMETFKKTTELPTDYQP